MKKVILICLVALLSFTVGAQKNTTATKQPKQKIILLMNPTVYNIKTIEYLTQNGIFSIDSTWKFVGVYHKHQSYDFNRSQDYVKDNERFTFFMIADTLTNATIFDKNNCTDEFEHLFRISKGIFFFGGPDIQPEAYGEENTKSLVTDPFRHMIELSFLHHLLGGFQKNDLTPLVEMKKDYVVTGFCLGMQSMNVATGGTMIQDIPAEVYGVTTLQGETKMDSMNRHRNAWNKLVEDSLLMGSSIHPIQFTNHPFFIENVQMDKNCKPLVYSYHHQAVEKIGKGLQITALSADGKIVEGLAHAKYPHVFAVQFHPEVPNLYENIYLRKFTPQDTPKSYHNMINTKDVVFHLKYWDFITRCFE